MIGVFRFVFSQLPPTSPPKCVSVGRKTATPQGVTQGLLYEEPGSPVL